METLEGARAAALARLGLHAPEGAEDIDPGVRADLDALVRLTAQVCDAPVAAVNLVDADRLWQAATAGVSPVVVPRAETLCDTTVRGRSVLHVPDLSVDARFAGHPAVEGRGGELRMYAGAPLLTSDGLAIGALCVLDDRPRALEPETLARLADLAHMVMTQFELRAAVRERDAAALLRAALLENIVGVTLQDSDGRIIDCNDAATVALGRGRPRPTRRLWSARCRRPCPPGRCWWWRTSRSTVGSPR